MNKDKICVVNFASRGRGNYNEQQLPLMRSVARMGYDGIFFSPDSPYNEHAGFNIRHCWPNPAGIKCHTHAEVPYQFKLGAIQVAREEGYKKIFWLDTTLEIVKDVQPLMDQSPRGVVAFHNLGHPTWKWISDRATANLGISEDDLLEVEQTWGGVIMFDFDNPQACEIFDEIYRVSMIHGTFQEGGSRRPGFCAHRHDQAAMSVIFWRYGVKLFRYGVLIGRIHLKPPFEYGNDPYIIYG
jgi:hypothetical protein